MSEVTIHIHEDDWGMRNLYPIAALDHAARDVHEAAEAGKGNRAPDGLGWTNVHLIETPNITFADVGLTVEAASQTLIPILPRVRKFTATATAGFDPNVRDDWRSYEDDAHCYGFDDGCFVKLDGERELVKYIWFEAPTSDHEQLAALRRAIVAIDALARAAVADYWLNAAGAVGDGAFLDRYFAVLAGEG